MESFIKKYQPKKLSHVVGQEEAVRMLQAFLAGFQKSKKKALLLHGPSGSGKTIAVHALAHEHDLELLEVNASDYRNKDQINTKIGSATQQLSLFGKQKLILVDEVDGLSGMKDRGGIQALVKLLEKTSFPIIMTANNPYDNKFSTLRRKVEMVQFNPLDYKAILMVLKKICEKEKIKFSEDALSSLSRRCGGDLRSAINDLEVLAQDKEKIDMDKLESLYEREKESSILHALTKIFKSTDPKLSINAFDSVREDLGQRFLWLDENLPLEYTNPVDLARAYDKLSMADVFNRRIRRWQHWRFLVYINAFITGGISVSKDEKYKQFVSYKPTGRLLKIWWANQKSMKKKAIALKMAEKMHTSKRNLLKDMDYLKVIFKKNKKEGDLLADYFNLDKEEVMWLRK